MIFKLMQINPDDLENDDTLLTIVRCHTVKSDAYDNGVIIVYTYDGEEHFFREEKGQYWIVV